MKNLIKNLTTFFVGIALIESCARICSKPEPTEYADATPEIKKIYELSHHSLDGLRLTVQEKSSTNYVERKINFLDYGFDGKLDLIDIRQKNRKDLVSTNITELTRWQPLFEQMRVRRFGEFTNSLTYHYCIEHK